MFNFQFSIIINNMTTAKPLQYFYFPSTKAISFGVKSYKE